MASLKGKGILVIDDAEDARLLTRKILQSDGAIVTEADSVDRGLSLARARQPHLVLTDLDLPARSGFDLLAALKKDPALGAIPVIVVSGLKDQKSVLAAVSLGASDYIIKPIRATQLLQKVRKALRLLAFHAKSVPTGELQRARLSVSAELVGIGGAGCRLDCRVKLSAQEPINIQSALLGELGLFEHGEVLLRTVGDGSQYQGTGLYQTEVNFVGIDHETTKKIRAKLGGLR